MKLPSTRFAGSKIKLVEWIWDSIKHLSFNSCLDAFGGMASVSYMFKLNNKKVHFNDILKCCQYRGIALIENNKVKVKEEDIVNSLKKKEELSYPTIIEDVFKDIYYTDEENRWLDIVSCNINKISNRYEKAILMSALFQACLIKRPFNQFHRKNLYLRTNHKKSNFNNYVTWERPFELYYRKFVEEINNSVITNNKKNTISGKDIFDLPEKYDLVYLDPPYISDWNENYLTKYHFLEGISDYEKWTGKINYSLKTRKFYPVNEISVWGKKLKITNLFHRMISKFQNSIIVLSYRADGKPTQDEIINILKEYKKDIQIFEKQYQYVLSPKKTKELLFVAE